MGLTWNYGEFVEGCTNLLWVLAAALLGFLGLDLILASRLQGLVSALAFLYALHRFTLGYRAEASLLPGMLLALSAPTAVWMFGGLETLLLCAFVALAATGLAQAVGRSELGHLPPGLLFIAVMFALAVLTRADAPVLVASFAVDTLLALRGNFADRMKAFALVSGIPFAAFLLQLGFRLAYDNSLLPNTFSAKFAVTDHRLEEGVIYFAELGWTVLPSLAALSVVLLLALWQPRPEHGQSQEDSTDILRTLALLLPVATAWTICVVMAGSDIFPAYRLALPLLVILTFVFAVALGGVPDGKRAGLWR